MNGKRFLAAGMACVLAMLLTSCGAQRTIAKPVVEEGKEAVEVEGSCSAELTSGGSVLNVSGESNLMDGTNGVLSVLGADGVKLVEHRFTQTDGTASWDFEVEESWPEIVYGFMSFGTQNMDSQPREVTEAYGRRFQNLEGPAVIWDTKGVIAVFQSEEVRIGPDAA